MITAAQTKGIRMTETRTVEVTAGPNAGTLGQGGADGLQQPMSFKDMIMGALKKE
jgi:hypothetical protein